MVWTILEILHVGATENNGGEGTAARLLRHLLLLLLGLLQLLLLLLQNHRQSPLGLGFTLGEGRCHSLHIDTVVGELGREITANIVQVEFLRLLDVLGGCENALGQALGD